MLPQLSKKNVFFAVLILVATCAAIYLSFFNSTYLAPQDSILALGKASVMVSNRPCDHEINDKVDISCFWVQFASNPKSPKLAVAKLSARGTGDEAEIPLLYLPGGPGLGSNTSGTLLNVWQDWYVEANLGRSLVVIDYRYLDLGVPTFTCEAYKKQVKNLLKQNLSMLDETKLSSITLNTCYIELQNRLKSALYPLPLRQISSIQNAEDARQIMLGLGFNRWHILGVSYGTRVAQVAALNQEEVQSIILDSPYTFSSNAVYDLPHLWSDAVGNFFDRCEKNESCRAFGVNRELFWALMLKLKGDPVSIRSENWQASVMESWLLNDVRFASFIYNVLYAGGVDTDVALIIRSLRDKDVQTAQSRLDYYYNQLIDTGFNELIYLATECNDNPASDMGVLSAGAPIDKRWQAMFEGLDEFDLCKEGYFKQGQLPEMKLINKPSLVVVGELDPITPHDIAKTLQHWLVDGYYWQRSGLGHAEFVASSCGKESIKAFLGISLAKEFNPLQIAGCR